LILFIGGLVISLTVGGGTSLGLIFGIPLLLAGIAVPLIMMRDQFKQSEVAGPCPYCGAQIKTSDATIRLECPACRRLIVVKEMKLYQAEEN
jgi:DNA-directed RNA polymerase subunit RPC12/RpoP